MKKKKVRPARFFSNFDWEITYVDYWKKLSKEERDYMNDFNAQLRDSKSIGICPFPTEMRREAMRDRWARRHSVEFRTHNHIMKHRETIKFSVPSNRSRYYGFEDYPVMESKDYDNLAGGYSDE